MQVLLSFSPLVSDVSFHSGVEVSGPWPDLGPGETEVPVGSSPPPIFEVLLTFLTWSLLFHSGVEFSGSGDQKDHYLSPNLKKIEKRT